MIPRALIAQKHSFFLFGPRLTGKSTWLKQNLPEALWIDLLNESNYQLYLSQPSKLESELAYHARKKSPSFVVIDEIQRIPTLLNTVHEAIEKWGLRFALSGSSARKLKRGGANLLAGRAQELHLFPLTSLELSNTFDLKQSIKFGTLPYVYLSDNELKKQTLRSYVSTYLREEVQAEGFVRNLPAFSKVLQLASECIAQEINFSSISRETGITSKTIRDYFHILEDTLIAYLLPPFTKSIRKQLAGSPKFYFFDNGVTNALREHLNDDPTGEIMGALFEQFIINQTRSLLSYQQFEGNLSFWKVRGGNELDLVISKGSRPILGVEIKSSPKPNSKDLAGIRSFQEEFPKVECILVSRTERSFLLEKTACLSLKDYFDRIAAVK